MAITRRGLLFSSFFLASAALYLVSFAGGCDDAYESPCEVASKAVLVRDPAISSGDALSLTRSFDKVIATWQRRDLRQDAGADAADDATVSDAGEDAGDAGEPPNEAPIVTAFEVALIDANTSALLSRATVPAPYELRQRRSSIEDIGIVPEDDGKTFLIHWKELSYRTDPVGRIVPSASLKTVYVTDGGASSSEVRTIKEATCDRCRVVVSFIPLTSETLLFTRIDDDRTDVPFGTPFTEPRFIALRLRRDGTTLIEPTPWLRLPLEQTDAGLFPARVESTGDSFAEPPGRQDLATSVDDEGRITIMAGPRAWLADSSPRLLRGPILLPNAPDSRVSWQGEREGVSLAWSVSPTTEGRGRDPSRREIFTGLVPADAVGVATRERVSLGRTTIAFSRRGDDLGVIFESDQRDLFAWLDPAGNKRGSDLLVATQPAVGRGEFGYPIIQNKHLLSARGDGRFTTLTLGFSELSSTEIHCAVAKKK